MMKTSYLRSVLVAAALFATALEGAIVYDNTSNFEQLFNDSRLESGDEVTLAGTARVITEFAFEYYAEFATTGDETAKVRFYRMDGAPGENPFNTPGTLLYESSAFGIESGYRTVRISELALWIPGDTFMFSVEFRGVTAEESVGLLYYDPPTVGTSGSYFWEKENGAWSAVASVDAGNNFSARVTAEAALQITSVGNVANGVAVIVAGVTAGRTYTLEYKTDLMRVGWQRGPSAVANGNTVTLVDTTGLGATFRLYRVEEI
jgi:hypothetical protein